MIEKADYQKDVESLRNDMKQVREDLSRLMTDMKDMAKNSAGSAKDMAEDQYKRRLKQAEEAYDAGLHALGDHPYTTAAVAFGVGVVLGKLLSSK